MIALLAQVQPQATGIAANPTWYILLTILISSAFTDNILLTRFLGMCPFLSVSRQLRSAFGMGLAVAFVTTFTTWINSWLYYDVMMRLTEAPYNLPEGTIISLRLILFIVVIAAFVQLMEMIMERISLGLYFALGIFLPLITVNCAILGSSLFMVNKRYEGWEALTFGFGAGVGWMIAIILMAGIRERLKNAKIPESLQGPGITLIITGIMALAFIGFSGMVKI
jgi:Na+-transporting NADH:ubiquinone oxidoreductase subunit E